jgi:acetoin utilization protein AcuB
MLVRDYMTRHPFMAEPDMSIIEAQRYMGDNNIRHLPIVGDGKRLEGLVTRSSLLVDPGKLGSLDVWEITRYLSRLTVADIMVKREHVVTATPDETIEEAARTMVERGIGCLPVVEDNVVVGLITENHLLRQLMEMMSMQMPGTRVTIWMPARKKGELAKLVGAIAAQGWGIAALGGVIAPKEPDKWEAVVKVHNVSIAEVEAALSQIEGQEIVDIREG